VCAAAAWLRGTSVLVAACVFAALVPRFSCTHVAQETTPERKEKSGALKKKAGIHPCLESWTGGGFSGHVVGVGSFELKKHAQDCVLPYSVRPAHAPFVCMPVRTACVCACEDDDWLPGAISEALHTHAEKYPPASKRQSGVLRYTQNKEEIPRSSRRTTPSVRFLTWRYMDKWTKGVTGQIRLQLPAEDTEAPPTESGKVWQISRRE